MNTQDNSRAEFENFASNILGLSIEKLINFCDGYIDNHRYEDRRTNDAWLTWQATHAIPADDVKSGWRTIDSAPKSGKEMFVVRAFNIDLTGRGKGRYKSDAYAVWVSDEGKFARWPHQYPPTHWMPLPSGPDEE